MSPSRTWPRKRSRSRCRWAISRRPTTRSSSSFARSPPRHLRVADGLAVKLLVVVHDDSDAREPSFEFERRIVMRHRAVAADVEAGPRDQHVKSELGLQRSRLLAVDQPRVVGHAGTRALGRRLLAHETFDMHAEPPRARRHLALRADDLVTAADAEVMHEIAVLDVKAVAGK